MEEGKASPTPRTCRDGDDGDVLVPLSHMDAMLGSFGFALLYVFPPPSTPGAADYDLDRLKSSYVALVDEDYPILVGEMHIDAISGAVSVKKTAAAREEGARGLRFESEVSTSETTESVMQSLSWDFMPKPRGEKETIAVKCTRLADGGLAIGVHLSHTLLDGEGMFTFMKAWGHHYSGVPKEERLVINHDRHLLSGTGEAAQWPHPEFKVLDPTHPAQKFAQVEASPEAQVIPATSQHTFHVSSANMAKIKEVATGLSAQGEAEPSYVSTIDAITALFTVLISRARGHDKTVRITTGVNARRRFEPPLPDNYAGNVIFNALSTYDNRELQPQQDNQKPEDGPVSPATLGMVARRIRASIIKRDDAFLRDAIAFVASQSNLSIVQVGTEFFFGPDLMFTSWIHMGMYDAAFDGTHPWYACAPEIPGLDGMNLITEATKGGDGVDVLVFLESVAMERLKELVAAVPYIQV